METIDPKAKIGNFFQFKVLKYEILILSIIVLLLCLKLLKVPHIGILISLVFTSIAVIYFFYAFAVRDGVKLTAMENFIQKLTGLACSMVIIGILFRIQHWPNSITMMTAGLLSLIVSLAFIIYQRINTPEIEKFDKQMILRIVILVLISAGYLYIDLK